MVELYKMIFIKRASFPPSFNTQFISWVSKLESIKCLFFLDFLKCFHNKKDPTPKSENWQ